MTIGLKATALLVAVVLGSGIGACSDARTTGTSTAPAAADAQPDGGLCAKWPATADTYDASTKTGCSAVARLDANGENICAGATEYVLVCNDAVPDAALGCHVAWPPNPGGGGGNHCCPCSP